MKSKSNGVTRRSFIRNTAIMGASVVLSRPMSLFANGGTVAVNRNIKSRGYAARDKSGVLSFWEFERRPVGDNDVLIEIKYSGVCHSDIHQERDHWGPQEYPQVPGHEIAGIVTAVGKNVTKFKVGDKAGVGCMVDSCMECESCKNGDENYCENEKIIFTYGYPDPTSPSGISQGGYSNNIVVKEHFAIKIPDSIDLKYAAPLLCAGITTYSPLMQAEIKKGDKVGVAGIGGLGHMAIKLAVAKGAEVYAFTTSPEKKEDILSFGAKEVIVVDSLDKLVPHKRKMDYMLSTIPYDFDIAAYTSVVKPNGTFTHVGLPIHGNVTTNFFKLQNRVKINTSLIGGIPETQEVLDYCAANRIYPQIQMIKAEEINDAWDKVVNKEARYRYVIDAATF